jgi:hypothetical protein
MDEMRQEWTGLIVCEECWEIRHPQDFVRGVRDDQAPEWQIRPCPVEKFTGITDDYAFTPPGPPPPTFCNSIDPTDCPGGGGVVTPVPPDQIPNNGLGKGVNGSNLVYWMDGNDTSLMYDDIAWTTPLSSTADGTPIGSFLNKAFPLADVPLPRNVGDGSTGATPATFSPQLLAKTLGGTVSFEVAGTRFTGNARALWSVLGTPVNLNETTFAINGMPTRTQFMVIKWPRADNNTQQMPMGPSGSVERMQYIHRNTAANPLQVDLLWSSPGNTSYTLDNGASSANGFELEAGMTEKWSVLIEEGQFPSNGIGVAGVYNAWTNGFQVQTNTVVNWRTTFGWPSSFRYNEQFNGTNAFEESWGEHIMFDRLLTNAELNSVMEYLRLRWNLGTTPITGNLLG